MNRLHRNVAVAVCLLIFSVLVAMFLQPTLTDMYFSIQPVMTLEESHNATLHEGYGKVYVVENGAFNYTMVTSKMNCIPSTSSSRMKLAGAWNPTYTETTLPHSIVTTRMRGADRFYVVWVVGGCK